MFIPLLSNNLIFTVTISLHLSSRASCGIKRVRCASSSSFSALQIAKGGVPLDTRLPQEYRQSYHVLREGDEIWDAKLNLANSNHNNNKFYMMQLLEPDSGQGDYLVWTRWGRVGASGQTQLANHNSKVAAKKFFEDKFRSKTTGSWSDREVLARDPKKYFFLKTDYAALNETESQSNITDTKPRPECQLNMRLQNLIKLVCNVDEMAREMTEIGYDSKKLPLGKLSDSTIKHGQTLLQQLADVIAGKQNGSVTDLSDAFYTVIPHNFGFQKLSSFVIRTPQDVKKKMEMLESLSEVAFATRLLSDVTESPTDRITASYTKLSCKLEHIPASDEVYKLIQKNVESTAGNTAGHTHYELEIEDIFAVDREGEGDRFRAGRGGKLDNHMLLWHGSRLTNWVGILSKGLLIAPPEAPSTGYMFGKGIYFADMVTKSANYCYMSRERSTGVLVLSEVALGTTNDLVNSDYDAASRLTGGKTATKGLGMTYPSRTEPLPDGSCVVPLGPCVQGERSAGRSLQYNEYIVYNLTQVRMRYLVRVRFKFK